MDQHHQTNLGREIEYSVKGRILEAGDFPGDLARHELLMDREFANAGEDPRKRLQHPPNVISGIHVRGIESRDHRIEPRLSALDSELKAIAMYASVNE